MRRILYLPLLILFISTVDVYPYFWDFPRYLRENTKNEVVTDIDVVEDSGKYFLFFLTRGRTHSAITMVVTEDFIKYTGPFQVAGRIRVVKDFYPQFDVISKNGTFYCVWNDVDGSIFFKKSENSAGSWTDDIEVIKPGEISFSPRLFLTNKDLLLSFHAESGGRRIDHFYMLSENEGKTWFGPYPVAHELGGSFFPSFAMDSENYFAAWQSRPLREDVGEYAIPDFDIYLSRTKDLKMPWEKPSNITLNPAAEDVMPLIELGVGKLKLYWESDRDGVWGIYYREYNLQGVPLSDTFRVNSPIFNAHDPRIVQADGKTLVFFVEEREGKRRLVCSEKMEDGFKKEDPLSLIDTDVLSYFPVISGDELHLLYLGGNGVAHLGPDRRVSAPRPVSEKQEYIGLHGATVSWEQAPDSSGIEGYCYVFNKDEKLVPEIVNLPATSRSLRLFSAEEGVYYLNLRAKDIAGNFSNTVTIIFISDLTKPSSPTVIPPFVDIGGYIEGDSALLRWTGGGDDVAGYTYTLSREETSEPPGKILTEETSVQFKALGAGVWHFKVAAIDRAGNTGEASHLSFSIRVPTPAAGFEGAREMEEKGEETRSRLRIFLQLFYGKKFLKPILFICFACAICFALYCFIARL
ncbi:MAG: hypothetical protein ACUVWJ_03330 [Spirochaetota bacterium]